MTRLLKIEMANILYGPSVYKTVLTRQAGSNLAAGHPDVDFIQSYAPRFLQANTGMVM